MRITEITPDLAEELIQRHIAADPPARYEDADLIAGYAEDMAAGLWDEAGVVEVAGPDGWRHFPPGTILDGWHRLNAIVRSGVALRGKVVRVR